MRDSCQQPGCGTPIDHQDFAKLAQIRWRVRLCSTHYLQRKASDHNERQLGTVNRCTKCGTETEPTWKTCQACTVRERVGADYFECDCGQTVLMHESVRVMRKDTHKIERVCNRCATEGACRAGAHVIQTPAKAGWNPAKWGYEPVPDDFPRGYCSGCDQQMYFDGKRWGRMNWSVLAEAWDKART